MRGPHDLSWETVGASLRPRDGGYGTIALHLEGSRIQWINQPHIITMARGPGVDMGIIAGYGEPDVARDRAWTGNLLIELDRDHEELRVLPQDHRLRIQSTQDWTTIASAASTITPPPNATIQGLGYALDTDIRFPKPHTHARVHDATITNARANILVPAGTVWFPGAEQPLEAGRSLNLSQSIIDPITGTGRYVYNNWMLLVTGGQTDIATTGIGWNLATTQVRGGLDGTARWQGIVGAVAINGTRTTQDPETLEIEGALQIHSKLQAQKTHWSVQGQAVRVELNNEPFWQSPTAIVGLGLLATALALLGSGILRGLTTFVLGRSTPTIARAELDSPGRRRILQAIHEHQPVRPADLSRITGLPRGTLRYHLRVLDAFEVLQTHIPPGASARSATLMLNSGSHTFLTAGIASLLSGAPDTETDSVRADEALSVAHGHPLRRALYEALRDDGPADFQELRKRLRDRGTEPDLQQGKAGYHLGKLCAAGAAVHKWLDGCKVYEANLDPTAVKAEQYRRYLGQQGALALIQQCSSGTLARSHILDQLQQHHRNRRKARAILRELVAVAILEPTAAPNQYRLTPPLQAIAPTLKEST